jgi:hypothetical protein
MANRRSQTDATDVAPARSLIHFVAAIYNDASPTGFATNFLSCASCGSRLKIQPCLLPRRRSLQTATILVLFEICDRTLRRRDEISATPSGWIIF